MSTLAEKLHKWSLEELHLVSEGGASRIPDISSFRSLTKGKNKRIWNYVVNHVRSQSKVRDIKRTLYFKKLLDEKEDNILPSTDSSIELEKLQSAITRAKEKRAYLIRTISTIEEQLLKLEQKIQNIKEETFEIHQKAAIFELLYQQLTEKKLNVKNLYSEISIHKNNLTACESAKICIKTFTTDLYDNINNEVKYFTENAAFNKNCSEGGVLNKQTLKATQVKKSDLLVSDLVNLLKENSATDLQCFITANLQQLSSKEFTVQRNKSDSSKALAHLKCKHVYNSVSAIKNKKQIEKLLTMKENKLKDVQFDPNDLEFELKCKLIEKLAENEALIMSNNYMDEYLKSISNKTDLILRKFHHQRFSPAELTSVPKKFYDNSCLTYYLLYTASDALGQVLLNLNSLQLFASKDMFDSPLPAIDCLENLKTSLSSDRIKSLNYCDKINLMSPLFSTAYANPLPSEALKPLLLQPYQNVSFLCKSWTLMKQKLQNKVIAYSERFVENKNEDVPEMYKDFLQMLERMQFSVEKGVSYIREGVLLCDKTKSEIREWWEQNAQYIPRIEYEGKTLKMWIDILCTLSNFEPL